MTPKGRNNMSKDDYKQTRLFKEKLIPAGPKSGKLFDTEYETSDTGQVECLGITFENDEKRLKVFCFEMVRAGFKKV